MVSMYFLLTFRFIDGTIYGGIMISLSINLKVMSRVEPQQIETFRG